MIDSHDAAAEKLLQRVQQLDVPLVLNHCELWEHLNARGHFRVPVDADEEATLSIDKTNYPVGFKLLRG